MSSCVTHGAFNTRSRQDRRHDCVLISLCVLYLTSQAIECLNCTSLFGERTPATVFANDTDLLTQETRQSDPDKKILCLEGILNFEQI